MLYRSCKCALGLIISFRNNFIESRLPAISAQEQSVHLKYAFKDVLNPYLISFIYIDMAENFADYW